MSIIYAHIHEHEHFFILLLVAIFLIHLFVLIYCVSYYVNLSHVNGIKNVICKPSLRAKKSDYYKTLFKDYIHIHTRATTEETVIP